MPVTRKNEPDFRTKVAIRECIVLPELSAFGNFGTEERAMQVIKLKTERSVMKAVNRLPRWLSWSSFVFAFLQSACAAVVAISGIRVLIGLGALAAAAGTDAPPRGFHQDAIRIPMMLLALAGALINLFALWRVRTLRKRPAAQWRVQPLTAKEKRSEWLQLALLTLVLLAAEWYTHSMIHHPHST
jgi:hypothetical protein